MKTLCEHTKLSPITTILSFCPQENRQMSNWQGVRRVLQSQFASCYLFLIPFMHFPSFSALHVFPCFPGCFSSSCFLWVCFSPLLKNDSFMPIWLIFSVSSSFISYIFPPFQIFFYIWLLDTCYLRSDPVFQVGSLLIEEVRFLRSLVLTKSGARQCPSDIQIFSPVP